MAKTIDYYFTLASPWSYLGHERFIEIATRHKAVINFKPTHLGAVFAVSGGLPLPQRAQQRQAYRLSELKRWKKRLGLAFTIEPAFFPVDDDLVRKIIIAAQILGHDPGPLSYWYHCAIWVNELNVADEAVIRQGLEALGLPVDDIMTKAQSGEVDAKHQQNIEDAIEAGVFGAPAYVIDGELFWGQDRLDFVDEKLAQ